VAADARGLLVRHVGPQLAHELVAVALDPAPRLVRQIALSDDAVAVQREPAAVPGHPSQQGARGRRLLRPCVTPS
jgi:hypothetical protein